LSCGYFFQFHIDIIIRSPAVAEIADRTAYDALINDHLHNNTLQRF